MIVMKFGGTSVGNAERIADVAALVLKRKNEHPIVVVSAVGGITNLLIEAGEKALQGSGSEVVLEKIKATHLEIVRNLKISEDFVLAFHQELTDICHGIACLKEFTPRIRDLVTSFGERTSARLLAEYMKKKGASANAYDAWEVGFITNSEFSQAQLLPESSALLKKSFEKRQEIPIVTGFIGKDREGRITTLGRGGSDYSASLIGAAVGALSIEIWTDVSGIMTADPRLIQEAQSLRTVSFQEAAELSYFGARVLHPKSIEPAMEKNIPVLVKNTFQPEDPGTTILPETSGSIGLKAVTSKKGITCLNLYSTGMFEAKGFLAKIFHILESHGMSVDVVATSQVNVSLTLDNVDGLEAAIPKLAEFSEVSVVRDLAIVCLVGNGLKETPGISGRAFRVLGESGINIEMISQGASQINLTFVVKSQDATKAVKLLHHEFFEPAQV